MANVGTTSTTGDLHKSTNGSMMGDMISRRVVTGVNLIDYRQPGNPVYLFPFRPGILQIWLHDIDNDPAGYECYGGPAAVFSFYWDDYNGWYTTDLLTSSTAVFDDRDIYNCVNILFDYGTLTFIAKNDFYDSVVELQFIFDYTEWA